MSTAINYRKYTNSWRLNNTLLNDNWVTEAIKEYFKKSTEFKNEIKNHQNENKNILQNLWDAIKAVLRGRTIAIKYLHHKVESSQVNNTHEVFEKKREQMISKNCIWEEIAKKG